MLNIKRQASWEVERGPFVAGCFCLFLEKIEPFWIHFDDPKTLLYRILGGTFIKTFMPKTLFHHKIQTTLKSNPILYVYQNCLGFEASVKVYFRKLNLNWQWTLFHLEFSMSFDLSMFCFFFYQARRFHPFRICPIFRQLVRFHFEQMHQHWP